MRSSALLAVLVLGITGSACITTNVAACPGCRGQVTYPPFRGKVPAVTPVSGTLPPSPGHGFLYTRIVHGNEDDKAYAWLVHVADTGPILLAVVGPLVSTTDYGTFYAKLCATYRVHGPGGGVCCGERTATTQGTDPGQSRQAQPLTPLLPIPPPPPLSGSAMVLSNQQDAVNPGDGQLAGDALGAASSGVNALNGS